MHIYNTCIMKTQTVGFEFQASRAIQRDRFMKEMGTEDGRADLTRLLEFKF